MLKVEYKACEIGVVCTVLSDGVPNATQMQSCSTARVSCE